MPQTEPAPGHVLKLPFRNKAVIIARATRELLGAAGKFGVRVSAADFGHSFGPFFSGEKGRRLRIPQASPMHEIGTMPRPTPAVRQSFR